jgi:Protein of unknown function (DUF541)
MHRGNRPVKGSARRPRYVALVAAPLFAFVPFGFLGTFAFLSMDFLRPWGPPPSLERSSGRIAVRSVILGRGAQAHDPTASFAARNRPGSRDVGQAWPHDAARHQRSANVMSPAPRLLATGAALGLIGGLLAGVALTPPRPAAAATAPPAPATTPSVGSGATGVQPPASIGAAGVGPSGTAIAYPAPYPGAPGVAADHTIVVTGVGQTSIKSAGADTAAAQKAALLAALADARAQAEVIAAATGLSIRGVLSVSAVVAPAYGIEPMAGASSGSGPALPPVAPVPVPASILSVSVTVAYTVG